MTRAAAAVLVCACALGIASPVASAHQRSVSDSVILLRSDGATLRLRLSALDRSALAATGITSTALLARHLGGALALRSATPCEPEPGSFRALVDRPGWLRFEWRVSCAGAPSRLRADVVPTDPAQLHVARVRWAGQESSREIVLTERRPEVALAPPRIDAAVERASWVSWVPVGVAHILGGWDHLVFLAMLILIAASLREVAAVVTGFTLGHTVTLSVTALGLTDPNAPVVEALIGLSIVLVAIENVWLEGGRSDAFLPRAAVLLALVGGVVSGNVAFVGVALFAACHFALLQRVDRPVSWRWTVAALFGLFHGFGFAGVLGDLGMAPTEAPASLLGFNLGVELGQLFVVALAWPLLVAARSRWEGARPALARWGSAAGLCAGVYWMCLRLFAA